MKYRYLLDTNIISAMMRDPQGHVVQQIARVGANHIATNVIVLAELQFGIRKKRSKQLQQRLDLILPLIPVLALERDSAESYAMVRDELECAGTPIGPNDMLIAAHALSLGMTVVTTNVDEFKRVRGLSVENWCS